jgi:hypothetical protein
MSFSAIGSFLSFTAALVTEIVFGPPVGTVPARRA